MITPTRAIPIRNIPIGVFVLISLYPLISQSLANDTEADVGQRKLWEQWSGPSTGELASFGVNRRFLRGMSKDANIHGAVTISCKCDNSLRWMSDVG